MSLLMFLTYFRKFWCAGQAECPHLDFMAFYVVLQKLDPLVQICGQSYERNLINLPPYHSFAQILS